jgi:coenzyme F420-0:L-glutamate ligase / coenzyme F420-1:gamma-L-glutamate ligase
MVPDMSLTITSLPGIPIIHPGDDLVSIILLSLQQAGISQSDEDMLVLAQKIAPKADS